MQTNGQELRVSSERVRRGWSAAAPIAFVCAVSILAGCSAPSDGVTIQPVVIHAPESSQDTNTRALEAYYQTVFTRMRDALHGGDADALRELRYLILLHKSEGMIESAADQMARFELLADGLEFELGLPSRCRIEMVTKAPHAHAEQKYRFHMGADGGDKETVVGGGGEHAARFLAHLNIRDFDATGQHVEAKDYLRLPPVTEGHEFRTAGDLVIPFELPASRPETVIRELRISVEMLPGVVRVDDRTLPVSQISRKRRTRREIYALPDVEKLHRGAQGHALCCEYSVLLFPDGYEHVQRKPLDSLLSAMQRGKPEYFSYIFLGAYFMPEKDKEKAMSRLIRWVRNGTPAQALVAMGSLRVLSRENIRRADRDGWLLWWSTRTSHRSPK